MVLIYHMVSLILLTILADIPSQSTCLFPDGRAGVSVLLIDDRVIIKTAAIVLESRNPRIFFPHGAYDSRRIGPGTYELAASKAVSSRKWEIPYADTCKINESVFSLRHNGLHQVRVYGRVVGSKVELPTQIGCGVFRVSDKKFLGIFCRNLLGQPFI